MIPSRLRHLRFFFFVLSAVASAGCGIQLHEVVEVRFEMEVVAVLGCCNRSKPPHAVKGKQNIALELRRSRPYPSGCFLFTFFRERFALIDSTRTLLGVL